MANDNEDVQSAIFKLNNQIAINILSNNAKNAASSITNHLEQKKQTLEEEVDSIDSTLMDINYFIKENGLYEKLKNSDKEVDPCVATGFYLNQLKFDIDNANELWHSNGPWAYADNSWSVTPEEMEEVLSKIKEKFDILSSYAEKCATKL